MKKLLKKIDDAYVSGLTWATSSKGAMYTLTAAIWISVALNPPKTIYEWLIVIVSVFYQGVALPGLGYQTNAEGKETRQLMLTNHQENQEELADIKEMQEELKEMHQELKDYLKK